MKKAIASIYISLFVCLLLSAQTSKQVPIDIQKTQAILVGKTPPLKELVPLKGLSPEKKAASKKRKKKIVDNFNGRTPAQVNNLNALPQGVDPLRQTGSNNAGIIIDPMVNIDGMDETLAGVRPPDPSGDIGKDYYVQMVNATYFQVFDKLGNEVTAPIAANTIWASIGFSSEGDPIVIYDQEAERWIITEFPNGNTLLFAISETSDPMGSWFAYNFGTPSFPDYPKYSIWNNAYTVTTNEGSSAVYFIDRAAMLDGNLSVDILRTSLPSVNGSPGFFVASPVDWTGMTPPVNEANPMVVRLNDDAWGDSPQDQIDMYTFDLDWDEPTNSVLTLTEIVTAPFDSNPCSAVGGGFACIPEMGGSGLDGLTEVIMHQVHYRNFGTHESIVLNFIVDATAGDNVSGIRWMELRRNCDSPDDWFVYQEGTYAPDDGLHRFMGGIAMDGDGNIGLAYAVSSPNTFAGLRMTGRKAGDPLGQLTIDEYEITQGFSANANDRYGDYSQMTVDPFNDQTFWFTAEYRKANGWGTKIVSFEIEKDEKNIGPIALVNPQTGLDLTTTETVSVSIKNFGSADQTVYDLGYILDTEAPVIESVNTTIPAGDSYIYNFATTADLSALGDHTFILFSGLEDDENIYNDTVCFVMTHLGRNDASITDIQGLEVGICSDTKDITIELTNSGTENLTSATISIELNSTVIETINWTGNLAFEESEIINATLIDLLNGMNSISVTSSMPNGVADEVSNNDNFMRTFDAITEGIEIAFELVTDDYPNETTWSLADEDGNPLYNGGPYQEDFTTYTETWCLSPDACYTFVINDGYGDGICCSFGDGSYTLFGPLGNTIATGGEFGDSETAEFCPSSACQMSADIAISPETATGAADGALLISPLNGMGPYLYSINGGTDFQDSNIFENLPAGDYDVIIQGAADCYYEETVTVPLCMLSFSATISHATEGNNNDGSIEIIAANGTPPYEYSLDGNSFQFDPLYPDLQSGEYVIIVRDANGCQISEVVEVLLITSAEEITVGQSIEVLPNPNNGIFTINITGLNKAETFLRLNIYDSAGKFIYTHQLVRYDDTYTGMLSLVAYPAGVYYIRFLDKNINRMVRVIKN